MTLAGGLFYICRILAFLVRISIFLVPLCLPRSHIETPFPGSMVVAGVLLRLGG